LKNGECFSFLIKKSYLPKQYLHTACIFKVSGKNGMSPTSFSSPLPVTKQMVYNLELGKAFLTLLPTNFLKAEERL
jgi:hypothetical protein